MCVPLDITSDGETNGNPKSRLIVSLPCSWPSCTAKFENRSKLNKHRNKHKKPYECLAEGCNNRFAQSQALNRHTQTKHADANNLTKYYHCTVDGCKYSSTCRRRKRLTRLDQIKEHIKDYGHYGPHSANDRPRRPGKPLHQERRIIARFEEWILDKGPPKRTVKLWEYNSFQTNLWHTDDIGDLFLVESLLGGQTGHECLLAGCYYNTLPPDACVITLFKTMRGLLEHCRRTHYALALGRPSPMHPEEEGHGIVSSLGSMEPSNHSLGHVTPSSNLESTELMGFNLSLLDMEHVGGAESCLPPVIQSAPAPSDTSSLVDCNIECLCPCPFFLPNLQQPNHVPYYQFPGLSSGFQFSSTFPVPDPKNTYFRASNISEDSLQFEFDCTPSSTSSLTKEMPLTLAADRIPCTVPGCDKTFRRKYELERHVASVHDLTRYRCDHCRRQFCRKDKLHMHVRQLHPTHSKLVSMKMGSLPSDLMDYSGNERSSSEYPSGTYIAPADILLKVGSSTETQSTGILNIFQPLSLPFREQDSSLGDWQSATPKPLQLHAGTIESPIIIDESRPLPLESQ